MVDLMSWLFDAYVDTNATSKKTNKKAVEAFVAFARKHLADNRPVGTFMLPSGLGFAFRDGMELALAPEDAEHSPAFEMRNVGVQVTGMRDHGSGFQMGQVDTVDVFGNR